MTTRSVPWVEVTVRWMLASELEAVALGEASTFDEAVDAVTSAVLRVTQE